MVCGVRVCRIIVGYCWIITWVIYGGLSMHSDVFLDYILVSRKWRRVWDDYVNTCRLIEYCSRSESFDEDRLERMKTRKRDHEMRLRALHRKCVLPPGYGDIEVHI